MQIKGIAKDVLIKPTVEKVYTIHFHFDPAESYYRSWYKDGYWHNCRDFLLGNVPSYDISDEMATRYMVKQHRLGWHEAYMQRMIWYDDNEADIFCWEEA